MSKGRNQKRRQAEKRVAVADMATINGQLKVTIATLPDPGATEMISRDIELSRSALLYADTIEIVSPVAQMLDSVIAAAQNPEGMLNLFLEVRSGLLEGDAEEQLRQTQRVLSTVMSPVFREQVAQLPPDAEGGAQARELIVAVEAVLHQASSQLEAQAGSLHQQSRLAVLQPAIDQGIVTIHRAGYLGADDADEIMTRFVEHLDRLLRDPSTQLLLDDGMADLARSRDTAPSPFVTRNAQEAFVGSGLIARLPTLQTVPVDELLDLRSDLDHQRRRYLRAVSALSQKMTTTAFAPERAEELTHLWLTDVRPTLDELQDQLAEHSLVREFAQRLSTDVQTIVTAAAAGGLGSMSLGVLLDVDLFAALAAGTAPAAGAVATSLAHAAQSRRAGRREATTQDLYYLVSLQKQAS